MSRLGMASPAPLPDERSIHLVVDRRPDRRPRADRCWQPGCSSWRCGALSRGRAEPDPARVDRAGPTPPRSPCPVRAAPGHAADRRRPGPRRRLDAGPMKLAGMGSAGVAAPDPGASGHAQSVNIDLGAAGQAGATARLVQLTALVTVLSLAPSLLVMTTAFTRIVDRAVAASQRAQHAGNPAECRADRAGAVPVVLRDGAGDEPGLDRMASNR